MTSGASNASNDTGDVNIPAATAKRLAELLRWESPTTKEERLELANVLDPPQPSLRDEVARVMADEVRAMREWDDCADVILALMTGASLGISLTLLFLRVRDR